MKIFALLPVLAAAVALASCTVGPNYQPSRIDVPNTFTETKTEPSDSSDLGVPIPGQEAVQRWWTTFHDDELDSLINRAVRGNADLKIAASRVRQARAERSTLVGGLYPGVKATAGYNRGHGSSNVQLPFGNASSGSGGTGGAATSRDQPQVARDQLPSGGAGGGSIPSSNGGTPLPSGGTGPAAPQSPFGEGGLPGATTNLYQVGFDATWEIDLFGGARRALQAANAQIQVAEEGERGALVSLLGEVAQTYVQLRSIQQRLAIARANLTAQRNVLEITRAKFNAGFGTELNVDLQATQVAATAATIPSEEAEVRTLLHALAFMIGVPSNALADELGAQAPLPTLPPTIPIGIPSNLLRRRPDVRQAERELAAAVANVGMATAELFPRFSLTGALGLDSTRAGHLPKWSSHYYSIIPGVSWPILDWGRARARVAVQNEVQQQALSRYENTVAQALRDVEDALVKYQFEQSRRAFLDTAVKSSQDAFSIARAQFEHGVVDFTVVLDAQRSLLSTEDTLAQSDGAVRTALIGLYKALGGGWDTSLF